MEIVIRKNVPIPSTRTGIYIPLDKMVKGDYIFVPATHLSKASINNRCTYYCKLNRGVCFACRKQTENGVEGTGVWRTA